MVSNRDVLFLLNFNPAQHETLHFPFKILLYLKLRIRRNGDLQKLILLFNGKTLQI